MDEVFKSELYFEHDHIVHKLTQPSEDLILERNKQLRNNTGAIRELKDEDGETWGRMLCSVPMIIWNKAIKDGFDLNSSDGKIARRELMRFLATDIGKACLVEDKRENKIAISKTSYFSEISGGRSSERSGSV
jgi:hypothetical protein